MEYYTYRNVVKEAFIKMLAGKKVKQNVLIENDIQTLKGILRKYEKLMEQITIINPEKISLESLNRAKRTIVNYYIIRKRHPEVISKEVDILMDRMFYYVCIIEGILLQNFAEKTSGVDIKKVKLIFSNNDCNAQIEKYTCKSIAMKHINKTQTNSMLDECNFVTVFIDESIRIDELGVTKAICNFSYVIVEGNLKKSSQIKNAILIEKGICSIHKQSLQELFVPFYLYSGLNIFPFQ